MCVKYLNPCSLTAIINMLNLFALTNNPLARIQRFKISNDLQVGLDLFLKKQEKNFRETTSDLIAFDGKYKPDFGEVLVIDDFDDLDGLRDAVASPLTVSEINPSIESFESIKALFSGYTKEDNSVVVLIQAFEKRRIISTNGISIFHSANEYKKIEGTGLTIDAKISAIMEDGKLQFFSFHILRQIFDLSIYYKEATDEDIKQFSTLPCIHMTNISATTQLSDNWIRRKLWLISQSQILQKISIDQIKVVAMEFHIDLIIQTTNGIEKVVIPENKKDLKKLLRFLDEDYYKSPFLNNGYISNSKRPIE